VGRTTVFCATTGNTQNKKKEKKKGGVRNFPSPLKYHLARQTSVERSCARPATNMTSLAVPSGHRNQPLQRVVTRLNA
jgi:hypothetical protein